MIIHSFMHYCSAKTFFFVVLLSGISSCVFAQGFVEDSLKYGSGKVYTSPEFTASFPGGKERMNEYVKMKLEMQDVNSAHPNAEGSLVAHFVVEPSGKVQYVHVAQGISPTYDEEVIRALASMPKWTPAKVGGEAVRSLQTYRLAVDAQMR